MTTAQHKTVNRAATVQKPAASLKGVQRQAVATRSSVQIQASMKVSSPKDPAEKEAEATAKKVMRMAIPESSIAYVKTGSDGLFRQVKQEEKEKKVQTKLRSPYISRFADSGIFTQRQAEDKIQRKAEGEPNVASNVTADIQNSMASGSPLPLSVRRFMEPRFQANFSNVKIHTGDKSAKLNRQLNAQAFTTGNQIFFGKDKFQPETSEGKKLIAHELTHTIQQGEAVQRRENVTVSEQSPIQVQRLGLSDALDYFADKANLIPGFRMFTIILGVNPINMSSVDRSAANILRAIVEFIPGGGLITQALDNHGVFEKVGKWVESQIKSLGLVGSAIKQAVTEFLDSLSWTDIFDLGGVWNRAKAIFTDPIDRIISFAKGLLNGIIEFIKDAILRPLAKLAEGTDGYDLLKAVLGKDPVTGDPVPQTADTLIGGFMKLIGQEEVWNNLKKANAVARAWAWFQGAKASLIGLVGQIPTMFINAFKSLELMDIVLLPRAFVKVGAVFGKFIGNFISWAGNAVWNLLEIIFDVVSPGAFGYIKKTGSALKSILKNPLPFIGNLVKAAKLGFQNFANNFDGHLKAGLIDWLTGSLPGVYIPKTFSLSEIVKFVFSVLGLTWQNIRQKLVAVVGETAVKAMETGFDIVMTLVTQGPAAAWDNIKEQLANLKDMVIGGISDFVVDMVKKRAIPKIVAMFIPGAGFISAIVSIYDTVMVFVNKISKIIQVVTGFINSISAIASGAIGVAASRVENTLAGLLSLAINFLAGFAGLGKVSDKVMGVINTKVRSPVDKAIDWLIKWIVTMAKKLGRFVAQAGVPQDPNERLRLAAKAAVAAAKRLSGKVTQGLLSQILAGIRIRYSLQTIVPYEQGGRWWVKATINPTITQDLFVPSERFGGGARPVEGPNYQPLVIKLTQVVSMFTIWAARGTSPVAQQMLRQLEMAREQAQALHEDQGRGIPILQPRMQSLSSLLRSIQALDPRYQLISVGEMSVTVMNARHQMPRTPLPPWTMLDPNLRLEYVRQLRDQEAGLNSMVADQWQQNRRRFETTGRTNAEASMRKEFGRRMGRPSGTAAPHNPDQSLGGFIDPTGPSAVSVVNSHIGSQNPGKIPAIEAALNGISPPARLITQLNFELSVV